MYIEKGGEEADEKLDNIFEDEDDDERNPIHCTLQYIGETKRKMARNL